MDQRCPPLRAWARADVIVYGEVVPPPKDGPAPPPRLAVLEVLKGAPPLAPDRTLTLDPPTALPTLQQKIILFCKGGKTLTRVGHFFPTSPDAPRYVKGLANLPEGSSVHAAGFFLRHVDHADPTVAATVYHELSTADPKHVIEAARKAPPDILARAVKAKPADVAAWVQPRHELYAMLLGYCGTAEHIDPLRELLGDRHAGAGGVKGALQGITLIRPAAGLANLRKVLHDSTRPLETRLGALQALEFFIEQRRDVLPQADLVTALVPALAQPDLADAAVECLRKWRRWELTRLVVRLWEKTTEAPALRRTVLRFALASPHPEAAAFIQVVRRSAPDEVAEAEGRPRVLW
jgi:hypothetical protein